MSNKVYTHNDYYGYVNDITQRAISNPAWFWSDSSDASEARQWLYNNGAGEMINTIYEETPKEIQDKINKKKLPTSIRSQRVANKTSEGISQFGEDFAPVLAAAAATPFAIGSAASAIGSGAVSNAGRYALGKIDDAVAWLSKAGTKWYDPRHIGQVIVNPTKAYTGLGEAAFATADLAGGVYGLNRAGKKIDGWVKDPSTFSINQIPEVTMDALGGTALFAYGNKVIPVVKGVGNFISNELPKAFHYSKSKNLNIIPENISRNMSHFDDNPFYDIDFRDFDSSDYSYRVSDDIPSIIPTRQSLDHKLYVDGSAQPIIDAVENSIGVFDKSELPTVVPEIRRVIEGGYDSGKDIDEILGDLDVLFEKYNKPFLSEKLKPIYSSSGNTYVRAGSFRDGDGRLVVNDISKILSGDYDGYRSNPNITRIASTPETISYEGKHGDDAFGYNDNSMFDTPREELLDWQKEVADRSLHGSVATENSKSLQSSTIAHGKYTDYAKNGDGVIVFMQNADGTPVMVNTNGLEQSVSRPGVALNGTTPIMKTVSTWGLMDGNIRKWAQMLDQTDPRALRVFGGKYPELTLDLGGDVQKVSFAKDPETGRVTPIFDRSAFKEKANQFDESINAIRSKLISENSPKLSKYDGTVLSSGDKIRIENNMAVIDTPNGSVVIPHDSELVYDYDLDLDDPIISDIQDILYNMYKPVRYIGINQPQAGFRKFKKGGIINRLDPKICKLLNITLK